MKTPPLPRPNRDPDVAEDRRAEQRAASVCLAVIRALGRPPDLFGITAVWLWENHFRVNVRTGTDVSSACIPHSFFVTADAEGNVLASVPQLGRVY